MRGKGSVSLPTCPLFVLSNKEMIVKMSRPPRQRLENSSDPFASRSDSVRNPVDSELSETIENYGRYFESDRELLETRAIWPVCPECGHRRTLRCPDCGATGDLFPPGDVETWNAVPSDVDPVCHGGTSCHGGSGCCHGNRFGIFQTIRRAPRRKRGNRRRPRPEEGRIPVRKT